MMKRDKAPQGRWALVALVVTFGISGWLFTRARSKGVGKPNDIASERLAVAVSPELTYSQSALKMKELYAKMDSEFAATGLNSPAIKSMQPWFHGFEEGMQHTTPWPKKYAEFPEPLAANSVRLLVIPLEYSPSLTSTGTAITKSIMQLLPPTVQTFANARTHYHCTMFHTSQPSDPRPDATAADGGIDLSLAPGARRSPSQAELAKEASLMQALCETTPAPLLQVDRVLLASSGTLLITWVDLTGNVDALRAKCRETFPGASTKQALIIHTSLLRIVSAEQLPEATIADIHKECQKWTDKLKGQQYSPKGMWFINEFEFSTIAGDKKTFMFKS